MIPEPIPSSVSSTQVESQADSLLENVRAGYALRVLELVITSYKKMQADGRCNLGWKENKYTAVLKGYVRRHCQAFSRKHTQTWYVEREHYHDNENIVSGEGDPDKVPRIDIVVLTWTPDYELVKFPFEGKLIDEHNSTLIRLYIQKGLMDRYLTEKDYSDGTLWGGMIGYVLSGNHKNIVSKLNEQIDRQLAEPSAHLIISQPIIHFDAIYISNHKYQSATKPLVITHLFFPFFE